MRQFSPIVELQFDNALDIYVRVTFSDIRPR